MKFTIKNNITKKTITKTVEDIGESRLYYFFNYSLDETVDEGEWSYFLYDDDDEIVANGICQIGDYVPQHTIYDNNNQGYTQYNG